MKNVFGFLVLAALVGFSQISFAFDQPELSTNGTYQIEGNWSELKRGWNILTIRVTDVATQQPVLAEKLKIVYDMVGMPMAPPNNPNIEKGLGEYEQKIFLGMSGKWKFDIQLISETSEDSFSKVENTNH